MKENSLMAFIAGAAVGALLGILLAPEKGEVTRRKIKDAADEGIDLEPVRTKIRERLDDIEEKITERMADGNVGGGTVADGETDVAGADTDVAGEEAENRGGCEMPENPGGREINIA